jgi:hypothetical protein
MTAVLKMDIQELSTKFVEDLKHHFASSEVEIHVHDKPTTSANLSTNDFWELIGHLDWSKEGDDAAVVEPVIALLAQRPLSHIYRFANILSEKLWYLDTKSHAQVFLDDPEDDYLSVDDFLYTRCAVVANGNDFYQNVLHNPSEMPQDLTFEPLLYIALQAYKRKTGKDFLAVPSHNYETYSNKKGWEK